MLWSIHLVAVTDPFFQLCHKKNFLEHLKTSSGAWDALCTYKPQPATASQSQCVSVASFYIKIFHQSISLVSENVLVCMREHRHDS